MGPAFDLVCGGEGRRDRQLVGPPGRPWSEDRTGGLRAGTPGSGVGEKGDAGDEGQQLDQAGLADLGQIINGARSPVSRPVMGPAGSAAWPWWSRSAVPPVRSSLAWSGLRAGLGVFVGPGRIAPGGLSGRGQDPTWVSARLVQH